MRSKTNILDLLNIFSITVVAGVMGSAVFFTRVFEVNMPWYWWIVLPTTVWVIYTLDHLFDGLKVKEKAQTIRHQMHYKYRKLIFWLAGIISAINIYLVIFYFDRELIEFGVTLSACVGAYLIIYQLFNRSTKKSYLKEITVALIYTVGIAGGPLVMADDVGNGVYMMISYTLLALCNLLIFSLFDYEKDRKNGFTSLAQSVGDRFVHILTIVLLVGGFLFNIYVAYIFWALSGFLTGEPTIDGPFMLIAIMLLMITGLLALLAFPKWFAVNERYRFLGDGVFVFPLILLCV